MLFRVFKRKQAKTTKPKVVLPPWEDVVRLCYEEHPAGFCDPVIQVFYSKEKDRRAVLIQKANGTYTVVYEQLYAFDEDELIYCQPEFPGYWGPGDFGRGLSLYDTAERAADEARAMLPIFDD